MTDLLDIPAVAEVMSTSPATLRYWIHRGTECGPLFGKFGRRRMIRRSDLDAWIASKVAQ